MLRDKPLGRAKADDKREPWGVFEEVCYRDWARLCAEVTIMDTAG